jgi:hypothetical protein
MPPAGDFGRSAALFHDRGGQGRRGTGQPRGQTAPPTHDSRPCHESGELRSQFELDRTGVAKVPALVVRGLVAGADERGCVSLRGASPQSSGVVTESRGDGGEAPVQRVRRASTASPPRRPPARRRSRNRPHRPSHFQPRPSRSRWSRPRGSPPSPRNLRCFRLNRLRRFPRRLVCRPRRSCRGPRRQRSRTAGSRRERPTSPRVLRSTRRAAGRSSESEAPRPRRIRTAP